MPSPSTERLLPHVLLTPKRSYSLIITSSPPDNCRGNSPIFGSGDTQRPKKPPPGTKMSFANVPLYPTTPAPLGYDLTGHNIVRTSGAHRRDWVR